MKYLAFSCFFLALEYGTAFILPLTTRSVYFRSPSAVTTSLQSSATEELTPGIEAINSMNNDIEPLLSELREQEYFRLYSVDMLGSCEYMPQELFECYSETCEIYPIDEEEVSLFEMTFF